jgi:hypothetical protein
MEKQHTGQGCYRRVKMSVGSRIFKIKMERQNRDQGY